MAVLYNERILILALLISTGIASGDIPWTSDGGAEPPSPPLDVELQAVNCTAIAVRWGVPWRHDSSVQGYRVFYAEVKQGTLATDTEMIEVPLSLDALANIQTRGHTQLATVIGCLHVGALYTVSVRAYGWAGQGLPSMPQNISTLSAEKCLLPAPPQHLHTMAASDTEVSLSWEPVVSGSGPAVQHYLVSYVRDHTHRPDKDDDLCYCPIGHWPELDLEWTSVVVPVHSRSVVLRGLSPETQYQFTVHAVNRYGKSPPSPIAGPIRTLGMQESGSGGWDLQYLTDSQLSGGGFSVTDYKTFTVEPKPFPTTVEEIRRPPLKSRSGSSASPTTDPATAVVASPFIPVPSQSVPTSPTTSTTSSTPAAPPAASTQPGPGARGPHSPLSRWGGAVKRLYALPCEAAACPPGTICVDEHRSGGSRCQCALGRGGRVCSEAVPVRFLEFYGHSYLALEPLKNSFLSFEIVLEFKANRGSGLLLYCGEKDHGDGDFISLALIRGRLHFRFNCGTGPGRVVSGSRVALRQWHTVTLFRQGPSGWLRLDNDTPVTGRSQGRFSKITFRTALYVGGSPSAYWLAEHAGTNQGFHGCIQSLTINDKMIDMRPWPMGSALSGADIGECSAGVCADVVCENGGECFANQADGHICLCPVGYMGPRCQESFQLSLPRFRADLLSYASVPWPRPATHYLSFTEFEITFRPSAPDGTLLYSDDAHSKDFLSLSLQGGHVEFRFDCGSGLAVIRSEEPALLNQWHDLQVSRTGRRGILQLDQQAPVEGMAEGAFTQIRCSSPLYVGGVPNYTLTKSRASLQLAFTGSIQKVLVNGHALSLTADSTQGVNVGNAWHPCASSPCANAGVCQPRWDAYECDCPLGYEGKHCQRALQDPADIPLFTGRSYLTYDHPEILNRMSGSRTHVTMRFRSTTPDGLLLWRGDSPRPSGSDFISLALQDAAVVFSYNLGSGLVTLGINGSFSDGRWHQLKAVRKGQTGKLTVDESHTTTGKSPGRMRLLNARGALYVGGLRELSHGSAHGRSPPTRGLVGCVSGVTLAAGYRLSLMEHATDGKNIHTCRS